MNICKQQFAVRNLGFRCKEDEKNLFYQSQWGSNRVAFLLYRTFMFLYSVGWTLAWFILMGINVPGQLAITYRFLTIWGDFANSLYFTLAFLLSIVGVVKRNRSNYNENKGVKVLRSATWLFFGCVSVIQIIILVGYWSLLAPGVPAEALLTPFNLHQHMVAAVLILIDVFVAAFPVRLFHVIYAMAGGIIYVIMTLILHAAGVTSAVYPFLNWADHPGTAAGISVGICFLGTILAECLIFGIYCLRLVIYNCACKPRPADRNVEETQERNRSSVVQGGIRNYAFSAEGEGGFKPLPKATDYF